MTKQGKDFPEFYLTRPQPCPYLPDRDERKLFTHLGPEGSVADFDYLHQEGFRRSQTIAYRPQCEHCTACTSVRIRVDEFKRSKSQKRVWSNNKSLIASRMDALSSAEQYALFKAYVETRHSDGGMADMTLFDYQAMIEDSFVDSFLREYRAPKSGMPSPKETSYSFSLSSETYKPKASSDLIAVALCDLLSDGISLVYSFFEPNLHSRSIGTYIILETIDYAQSVGLPYVYLGYWVKGSQKMDYKVKFMPQDHLINGEWVRVESAKDL
ncbi:arginyltransferase [Hyphomicrobiales bacterium 4NK60-0047b]